MTREAFIEALAWELTLRGVPFVRPDLEAFVDDVWPMAQEAPDGCRGAEAFLRGKEPPEAALHRELMVSVHLALEQAHKTLQQSREIVEAYRALVGSPWPR
jgi:hypothetical protein